MAKKGKTAPAVPAEPASGARGRPAPVSVPKDAEPQPLREARHYDMPFSAAPPRMINPEIGLPNLVSRAPQQACYTMDVTVLDTPDHRLLRAGVVLAHRVLDGRGEWYLGAPQWAPLLPEEQIEPMGQADLPADYTDLVMPFRRRGTLGPVAALTCERREFMFKNAGAAGLALLRDDRVTVSRGGLITARYREVTLDPLAAGLEPEQVRWIDNALTSVGATRVVQFPDLQARLGAPATGRTDFPEPRPVSGQSRFSWFVSSVLTGKLREIVRADLALRGGRPEAAGELAAAAGSLATTLQGLSAALDPEWLQDLDEELDWLSVQAGAGEPIGTGRPTRLLAQLRRERYLHLLERLITAARAPRLGASSELETVEVLSTLSESALGRFRALADRLRPDSSSEAWGEAGEAAAELRVVEQAVVGALGRQAQRVVRRLETPLERLQTAVRSDAVAAGLRDGLEELDPRTAFERGRSFEAADRRLAVERELFCAAWAKAARKLPG